MSEHKMYRLTDEEVREIDSLGHNIVDLFNRCNTPLPLAIVTLERLLASSILSLNLKGKTTFESCLKVADLVLPINIRSHMLDMQKEFENMINSLNN